MTNRSFSEFWKLLDLAEDYLETGYRSTHPEPPDLTRPAAADGSGGGNARGARTASDRAGEPAAAGGPETEESTAGNAPLRMDGSDDRNDAGDDAGDSLLPRERREVLLAQVAREVSACDLCRLCETRRNAVPGMGVMDPLVMVIGEGPGEEEDRSGLPFVGRAGQYLDKWLDAIGLSRRTNCWIGNVVKCRPPGNRDPQPDEEAACLPYLRRQISLLRPRAILTVGRISSRILTGQASGIGALRGRTYTFAGIPVIPTYHPSAVLRNQELRKPVWDDLQRLRVHLDG